MYEGFFYENYIATFVAMATVHEKKRNISSDRHQAAKFYRIQIKYFYGDCTKTTLVVMI